MEKTNLEIQFLTKCKTYDILPRFLRFKLYRKSLHSNEFHKSWQIKILDHEFFEKYRYLSAASSKIEETKSTILENFCLLDNALINCTSKKFVFPIQSNKTKKTLRLTMCAVMGIFYVKILSLKTFF